MNIKLLRTALDGNTVTAVAAFDDAPMAMNKVDDPDQSMNRAIFEKLAARRKTISDDVQVLIVPDKNVPYQDVITIYDECVKLQFKNVAFFPVK
jgi:biopolymer transport protein ExbD